MRNYMKIGAISLLALASAACTRIETGEVGIRRDMNKEIETTELQPGSWNQTMFGDVITFPTKDVQANINDMTPLASDNSTIKDFDLSVIYSVNPTKAAEIYIEKSRSYHADTEDGDTLLMYIYVQQLARNAAYKVARSYESLKMADNRSEIEQRIKAEIIKQLAAENLSDSVIVTQVLVRSILPADNIVASANDLVRAQNEQKQKEVEVRTAELESRRQSMLAQNGRQTIDYMNAEANKMMAQAALNGKVNTIIVSPGTSAMVNVK